MAEEHAKQLRKRPTKAEARLWSKLRRKQLAGPRFRRQAPTGPDIVGFFCPPAKLVVELDGGQHADEREYDNRRTKWLEARGYQVLRFWNNEAFENIEGVLSEIQRSFRVPPPP